MYDDVIRKVKFSDLDVNDSFFDSLKADYDFENWFLRKSNEDAYVFYENDVLSGFMYLKDETDLDYDIEPNFEKARRQKIGTFKINAHGTTLGQRFLSIALHEMIETHQNFTYVTLFENQTGLIRLFTKFGFQKWGTKSNGELVYYKDFTFFNDIYKDFPRIDISKNKFLLSIYPKYHTKMFPNSRLQTEKNHFIEDLSFTNTAEKIYIAGMNDISQMKQGDLIVIYRTKDNSARSAEYSSVVTSICTVVSVAHMDNFSNIIDYLEFCGNGSIFSKEELTSFYKTRKYPYIIKMLYNAALPKRIIRQQLINSVGLNRNDYFGVLKLSDKQFDMILEIGELNEGFIVN